MTIDTSREAVEQINKELSWDDSFGAIEMINALLAERDAALAEVARLSHALAAETAKREAMEEALVEIGGQSVTEWDCDLQQEVEVSMGEDEMGEIARTTLAKHRSKT